MRAAGTLAALVAGAAQTLLAILTVVLAAFALDWILRMPGPLRLAVAVVLLAFVATVLRRCVWKHLRLAPLPDVARQVQEGLTGPPDCLASGAEFAAAGLSGAFARRTVDTAAEIARQLSPARLIRWRWMTAWLAGAVLAAGLLVVAWPTAGWWVRRGAARYAWPAVRAEWPRRVAIVSDQAGQALLTAAGEPVRLDASIRKGWHGTPARLVLADGDHIRRVEMIDQGEGVRTATVRLNRSATFWFEAGDDDTADNPGQVRVVQRPRVIHAEVVVQPPAYTGLAPNRIALGSGPVRVPEGSRIDLDVTVSKPLASQDDRPAATITLSSSDTPEPQPAEPLDIRFGADRAQITAGWWCTRDVRIQATFVGRDGFENTPLQPWRVVVGKDELPAVQIEAPPDGLEVTPHAIVPLTATVADDWGIDEIQLAWRTESDNTAGAPGAAGAAEATSAADGAASAAEGTANTAGGAGRMTLPVPATQPRTSAEGVRLTVDRQWPLADLGLQPGDRLVWSLAVRDNFEVAGRRHDPVHSSERTIRVVSEASLLESVLGELATARGRVVDMLRQEKDLRETLAAAATRPADRRDTATQPTEQGDMGTTPGKRLDSAALARQGQRQADLARETREVVDQLQTAADRLHSNRLDRPDLLESVAWAGEKLSDIRAREMAQVQRRLAEEVASGQWPVTEVASGQWPVASEQRQGIADRGQQQGTGDRAQGIADRGQGSGVSEQQRQQQQDLTGGETAAGGDGRAESESQRDGGEGLAGAAQAAGRAVRGIEQVLAGTAAWTSLETAALGLENLIGEQRGLQGETARVAADSLGRPVDQLSGAQRDALARLAEQQRALAQRLGQLRDDMQSQAEGGASLSAEQQARLKEAADALGRHNAAAMMAAGAEEIARNVTSSAQDRQQTARRAMEQALEALKGEQAPGQNADRGADELAAQLRQLAEQQQTLRGQTGDINAGRDGAGGLGRTGLLRLAQAGQRQGDLAGQVRQAGESAQGPAGRQLLDAVASNMQGTAGRMRSGQSGEPVLDAQNHAADTLRALAEALEQAGRAERNGQGDSGQPQTPGGESGGAKAAEVAALYLLQADLLFRTQQASEGGGAPADELGREQQGLGDLAREVLGR